MARVKKIRPARRRCLGWCDKTFQPQNRFQFFCKRCRDKKGVRIAALPGIRSYATGNGELVARSL